jgi:2-polyprenyl-6-methoxyphenol hydroxylase-like FAD-dependent oxidoreductase
MTPTHPSVLIAGGGPVGMTLALELARHGVRSALFERAPDTTRHPKMDITNGRSMELFRRLGLANALRSRAVPFQNPLDVAWITSLSEREVHRFRYPSPQTALARYQHINDGAQPLEPAMRVSQVVIEPILKRAVLANPLIDARWQCSVEDVVQDGHQVTITVASGTAGSTERFSAPYLVGCDGGNSRVRDAVGIGLRGKHRLANRYMIHFRSQAREVLQRFGLAWHYQTPRGTLIAQDDHDTWTLQARFPEDKAPSDVDPRATLFAWLGCEIPADILVANHWTPHLLLADQYRSGRVFLAGDAAHQYIPTGGYGMNTGIGDAVGLGWMLAGAVNGWAGPNLLGAYEDERRPIGDINREWAGRHTEVRLAIAAAYERAESPGAGADAWETLAREIAHQGNAENECLGIEFAYRYENSTLVAPILARESSTAPPADPLSIPAQAWPGMRAPHLYLEDGRAVFDTFASTGYTLIRFNSGIDIEPLRRRADERRLPLSVVDLDETKARDIYGADLALIRPDQHLAWRGNAVDPDALDIATGYGVS